MENVCRFKVGIGILEEDRNRGYVRCGKPEIEDGNEKI